MVSYKDVLQLFIVNLHRNAFLLNAKLSFTMESIKPNAFGNIGYIIRMLDSKPHEMGSKSFWRISPRIDQNRRRVLCIPRHNIGGTLHKNKAVKKKDHDNRFRRASGKWV